MTDRDSPPFTFTRLSRPLQTAHALVSKVEHHCIPVQLFIPPTGPESLLKASRVLFQSIRTRIASADLCDRPLMAEEEENRELPALVLGVPRLTLS